MALDRNWDVVVEAMKLHEVLSMQIGLEQVYDSDEKKKLLERFQRVERFLLDYADARTCSDQEELVRRICAHEKDLRN